MFPHDNPAEGETPEQGLQRWDKILSRRMNMLNFGVFACILLVIGAILLNWGVAIAAIFMGLTGVVFIVCTPGPFVALRYKKKYRKMIHR
ncbi:hypothetical protein EFY87_15695 [Flexivirga caeni]|uniref:Uncharacterized protein n=1 Tax=Flexivirga caeni TaxID=2294115 RepID=A0A3M9M2Q1_9MICO|nr:hypothetical protein EFY87_15695 [Flexivirga caeni]